MRARDINMQMGAIGRKEVKDVGRHFEFDLRRHGMARVLLHSASTPIISGAMFAA